MKKRTLLFIVLIVSAVITAGSTLLSNSYYTARYDLPEPMRSKDTFVRYDLPEPMESKVFLVRYDLPEPMTIIPETNFDKPKKDKPMKKDKFSKDKKPTVL